MLKLNIGCGADIRDDYVNIDKHTADEIKNRYGLDALNDQKIYDYDVFDLPYDNGTVDEIMCLGVLEHFSFEEERKFFYEADRVLKREGLLHFTVPDFESLVKQWLEAKDDFKEFYSIGTKEHWFGNDSRTLNNRWGYLTASIFGNQNGEGQFHKNAYTAKKIEAIMNRFHYRWKLKFFNFKDTEIRMIDCKAVK